MVTIFGNGIGKYNFDNISYDLSSFDIIICDKNFSQEKLKYDKDKILFLSYKDTKEYLLKNYDKQNIAYVVTGSPLFFSAGIIVAKTIPKEFVKIVNNLSSKEYIQTKLFINDSELTSVSLHGRTTLDLTKVLTTTYTLILCDKYSIERVQKIFSYISSEDIEVTIGYKLGYEDEVITSINIFDTDSYSMFDLTQPYVLVVKRLFKPINILSQDKDFITQRGMITKKYKRDLALQNLDLEPNQILWDIGAGSGSCAIDSYKRYKVRTVLFENQPQRVVNIKQNLTTHKVIDTILYEGDAQDNFEKISTNPDKIFVGGGGEEVIKLLPYLYDRLEENGIILINAITLKHLTSMINILNNHNIAYEVISLALTTYKGKLDMIEPQRQLFQIKILKYT